MLDIRNKKEKEIPVDLHSPYNLAGEKVNINESKSLLSDP